MDSSRILRGTGRWCEHISNVGMMTRRAPSCPGVTQRKNLRQAAMDSHDINGDHQPAECKKKDASKNAGFDEEEHHV